MVVEEPEEEEEEPEELCPEVFLPDGSTYYPHNVFYDAIRNTCVDDCEKIVGPYVNPPNIHVESTNVGGGLIGVDTSNFVDDHYYQPDLTCQCGLGFLTLGDGTCHDCQSIDPDCCACEMGATGLVCTDCRHFALMVSLDGHSCVPKFEGCEIGFEDQPDKLPAPEDLNMDGELERYCPRCSDGWFLDQADYAGHCRMCNSTIEMCSDCVTEHRCRECHEPYFPSLDGGKC